MRSIKICLGAECNQRPHCVSASLIRQPDGPRSRELRHEPSFCELGNVCLALALAVLRFRAAFPERLGLPPSLFSTSTSCPVALLNGQLSCHHASYRISTPTSSPLTPTLAKRLVGPTRSGVLFVECKGRQDNATFATVTQPCTTGGKMRLRCDRAMPPEVRLLSSERIKVAKILNVWAATLSFSAKSLTLCDGEIARTFSDLARLRRTSQKVTRISFCPYRFVGPGKRSGHCLFAQETEGMRMIINERKGGKRPTA